jgi:hypothetical protein
MFESDYYDYLRWAAHEVTGWAAVGAGNVRT